MHPGALMAIVSHHCSHSFWSKGIAVATAMMLARCFYSSHSPSSLLPLYSVVYLWGERGALDVGYM